MQRNCIFPGRYAPLTYYEDVLEASRNTLMARNAREICNFFAQQNTLVYNGPEFKSVAASEKSTTNQAL